jgi:hypothetical protein
MALVVNTSGRRVAISENESSINLKRKDK